MGENPELENSFGKERLAETVGIIEGILKGDKKQFDVEQILQDKTMLRLIQAFDRPNGLEEMTVNNSDANLRLNNGKFIWADILPLKTIWQLGQPEWEIYLDKKNNEYNPYVTLFDMYNEHIEKLQKENNKEDEKNRNQKVHIIPEGIKYITDAKPKFMLETRWTSIRSRNYYKIVFPSTLKGIKTDFINGTGVYEIEFNEGLEEIGAGAFAGCPNLGRYKRMKMPQSLRKIEREAFYNCCNMAPLILNEGLEEIGSYALYNVYSDEVFSPETTVIIPSTVQKLDGV